MHASNSAMYYSLNIDKKFLEFFFKRVKQNTSGCYESEFPYVSPCGRETNYIRCDDLPIVFSHLLDANHQVIEDIAGYGGGSIPSDTDSANLQSFETHNCVSGETATADRSTSSCQTRTNSTVPPSTTPMHSRTSCTESKYSPDVVSSKTTSDGTHPLPPTTASLAYGGTMTLTVPFQPTSLCMLPASGRVYHAGPEWLGGVGLVKSSLAIELSRFFVYEEGARESAHPVGFRWQGTTWELDPTVLSRLAKITRGSVNDID